MASEWKTWKIKELIASGVLDVGDGYRAKNEELGTTGLPFARAGNINGGFNFANADRFPTTNLSKVGSKISRPADVVFTSKGTVGRFAFVGQHTESFVYSPQLCYWRSLSHKDISPRFLYYWMQSAECLDQFSYLKSQTDMADYVSLRDQREMRIALPDWGIQDSIAKVLTPIDDRIAMLSEESGTLEAIAGAIFKSWFVDFDPVRAKAEGREPEGMDAATAALFPSDFEDSDFGRIPKGWHYHPFGSLLTLTIGGDWGTEEPTDKNSEPVAIIRGTDMPTIQSGFTTGIPLRFTSAKKLESRRLVDSDIVIEVSGGSPTQPTGRSIFITSETLRKFCAPVVPASFCRLFRPTDIQTGSLLSQHLSYIYGEGKMWGYQNQSTGISNFQTAHFLEVEPVCFPSSEVLNAFHELVRPLIDRQQLELPSILAELRDTLLPRLISGKLRVPEAEKMLEAII